VQGTVSNEAHGDQWEVHSIERVQHSDYDFQRGVGWVGGRARVTIDEECVL